MGRGQAKRQVLPLQAVPPRAPFRPFEVEDLLLLDSSVLVHLMSQIGESPQYATNHAAVLYYLLTTQDGLLENHVRTSIKKEGHSVLHSYLANLDMGYNLPILDKMLAVAQKAVAERATLGYELLQTIQATREDDKAR